MKSKVILSGTLLVLLGSSVVWAGDPWKEKPWTEWTSKEVTKVLRESPWARRAPLSRLSTGLDETSPTADYSGPGDISFGQRARPDRLYMAVRWLSSLTLRKAIVRYWQLRKKVTEEGSKQFLSVQSAYYVIGIGGDVEVWSDRSRPRDELPVGTLPFSADAESFAKQLQQAAYLEFKESKRKVFPVTAGVVKEGPLVAAARVLLYFPKESEGEPVPTPRDKKVKFFCPLDIRTSPPTRINTSVEFDLRKMVRDGKPDL